ncbi:MAG TPA: hypothetical protein DHW82_09745 [Spirochaetia bacterium]|nr:MAG: hypothetical protein A2Y41_00415 [Spirochaetes bacterium GWB1_36_13]HCL57274.1 hypothetical protein [Spirochaetia bacterium]
MYCQINDLFNQMDSESLKRYAGEAEDTGDEYIGRVESAISKASAEIDGYLLVKYAVPLSVSEKIYPMVVKIAVDFALFNVVSRRGFGKEANEQIIFERYKNGIEYLKKISGFSEQGKNSASSGGLPLIKSPEKMFNDWRGF